MLPHSGLLCTRPPRFELPSFGSVGPEKPNALDCSEAIESWAEIPGAGVGGAVSARASFPRPPVTNQPGS